MIKKDMKNLSRIGLGILSSLVPVSPIFAQSVLGQDELTPIDPCPTGDFNPLCAFSFNNIIPSVVTIIIIIAILIALFFLIFGGIKWIISGGDKEGVTKARETIVAAIVGLVIVFLAWFILNIIGQIFFGQNLTDLIKLPQIGPITQ